MKKLWLLSFVSLFPLYAHAEVREYNLEIKDKTIVVNGRSLKGMAINGQVPAPRLDFTEGDDAVINVTNHSSETTSLHWHGLLVPAEMDGVPGLNYFGGIKPNESFTYKFKIRQSGTYWYHSHSGGQEARGLYGPLIIAPKEENQNVKNDYTLLLSDFSNEQPSKVLNKLKTQAENYNQHQRTLGDFIADAKVFGTKATLQDRLAWSKMRMSPTDLADVTGYDFIINGKHNNEKQTFIAKKGEPTKLRLINGSAMTFFDFKVPDLKMTVVAADGQDVKPFDVDELRIGVAETYDVIVTPKEDKAYALYAESMDRTGYAIANLAPQNGMIADVPAMKKRAILTMSDMGMGNMSGMDMSNMDMSPMSHDTMPQKSMNMGKTLGDDGGFDGKGRSFGWGSEFPADEKVLSYSDLASLKEQKDQRPADRTIDVVLGGNMDRYIWTINGKTGNEAKPINLKYGERVKLHFVNNTMMAHPMHLHGMFVQLDNGQDMAHLPNKHIVIIPPGQSYDAYLTANEIGEWSFHCHLLYHMGNGMMTTVVVAKYDGDKPEGDNMHKPDSNMSSMMAMHEGGDNNIFKSFKFEAAKNLNDKDINYDFDALIGIDKNKLRLRNFGERNNGDIWGLYSHYISDYWNLEAGIGSEYNNPKAYFIAGIRGKAPYNIETDAHLIANNNKQYIFTENSIGFNITNKIYFEPKLEAIINLKKNNEMGEGLASAKLDLKAYYKITPQFRPYFSYEFLQYFGDTKNMQKNNGEKVTNYMPAIGLSYIF